MPPTRWNVSTWRSNASVRTACNGELSRQLGLFRESTVAASRHSRMHRSQKIFAASAWPNNHFQARSTRVPSKRIADRVMATTGLSCRHWRRSWYRGPKTSRSGRAIHEAESGRRIRLVFQPEVHKWRLPASNTFLCEYD